MSATCLSEVLVMNNGKSLESLLNQAGKTLREVADICGVTHPTVIRWRKKNRVPAKKRDLFARAVGVDRAVVDEISDRGLRSSAGYVSSPDQVGEWRDRVMESDHDQMTKLVLTALPLLMVEPDWTVHVTIDALVDRAKLKRATVAQRWPDVLGSPFVARVGPVQWALKLRIPDSDV